MPHIIQLDRHVADLIAAGEVVERPASAVKELVENAVDAGATQITVEVQNGGMTFLRVTDNGCGIAPEDAPTAFLRHATSKIRTKEDLAAIGTLGFRGEALAAISSVSRIDLLTKTAEAEGVSLHLEGGVVTSQQPAGCPQGTTILVRDLFFNTPARMKFMKSDSAEAAGIVSSVQKQALAHPEISFRLIKDGQEVFHTPGDGALKSAVYCLYGREFAGSLAAVDSRWDSNRVFGYVTRPTATRGNRSYQQFFVNGRPVKSRLMSAALEQAYQNQMMAGRFPGCVLHLTLPPDQVDVNVHPAKTEVKFLSEKSVFDCVHYGVLATLNKTPGRPEMRLSKQASDSEAGEDRAAVSPGGARTGGAVSSETAGPSSGVRSARGGGSGREFYRTMTPEQYQAFLKTQRAMSQVSVDQQTLQAVLPTGGQAKAPDQGWICQSGFHAPASEQQGAATVCSPVATPKSETGVASGGQWQPLIREDPSEALQAGRYRMTAEPTDPGSMQQALELPQESFRVVGEVLDTYLIVQEGDTVYFIDKHAAHERILFEKLKSEDHPIMAQGLITPLIADLDREEAAAVLEHAGLLLEFGYEVADFGDGVVCLRQIPSDISLEDAVSSLSALAEDLLSGKSLDPKSLRDNLLHTIACKAAIKAGYHTQEQERNALVQEVLSRDDIKYCPHGRPVCITLTKAQLEKQFKRA